MAIWFECVCGVQNEAEPGAEGWVRCGACGAELDFGGVLDPAGANDPAIPDPKLPTPGSTIPEAFTISWADRTNVTLTPSRRKATWTETRFATPVSTTPTLGGDWLSHRRSFMSGFLSCWSKTRWDATPISSRSRAT